MPNPDQNCGNCYFMKEQTLQVGGVLTSVPCCRCDKPKPSDSLQASPARWAQVDPVNDWCGYWSVDGVGVFGIPGPQGPQGAPGSGSTWSFGTNPPSGGNDGDWYLHQTGSHTTSAIYSKVGGVWTLVQYF